MHCSGKLHCWWCLFSFFSTCVYNKYLVCLRARKGRYHEIIIMYLLPLSSSLLLATIHFRTGSFYRTNIVFYPFSFPFVSISMPNFSFHLFSLLSPSLSVFLFLFSPVCSNAASVLHEGRTSLCAQLAQ